MDAVPGVEDAFVRDSARTVWACVALVCLAVGGSLTPARCVAGADGSRPNVVLIIVDALRPDHLGCYGYQRPTSPQIDALARRGAVFQTVISHAPWTKTSFSSVLTSLYPFEHQVLDWESVLADSFLTLPEVLARSGYHTIGLININAVCGEYQVTQGIQELSVEEKKTRSAQTTTDVAIRMIKESPEPFLILIHYFDAHLPYVPPEGYVDKVRLASDPTTLNDGGSFSAKHWALMADSERPSDADISAGMMLYDACIRSIDDAIGRLASYLDETGLTNRSLVIVTADHGEAFWEHGVCRHGTNVYDEAIKVPLVIAFPDGRYSGREIPSQVELIDLMPSVLEAVGVPDSAHREGTSLIGLLEGGKHLRRPGSALPAGVTFSQSTLRDALGTRCLRTAEWKLILEPATALVQLYNLKADPAETRNLWGTGLTVGDSLHSLLLGLPGSRIRGWRIAFTGATGEVTYTVTSATASTAGVPRAEWLVHSTRKHHRIQTSGGSAEVQAAPTGLSLALVDFGGASDELTFAVDAEGAGAPESVYVGKSLSVPLGAVGKLRPETAYGLPDKFQDHRQNGRPGAFIWWLPGGKLDSSAETAPLGEQEKKRLKSIGYTH